MSSISIPHNWQPRWYQRKLWKSLERGTKRAIQIAHRRWGKDDVCLHWTARCMFERPGTYWHMLPVAKQARKAIWEAVNPHSGKRRIDEAFPPEIRETTREDEMFIRVKGTGSTWQVLGSDNYEGAIGSPPVGLVFSEWAQANPLAWAYLRPVLAENGGWALFITTPRGKNHAYKMLQAARNNPQWYADVQGVDFTRMIHADILANELHEMQELWGTEQGQSFYDQEYGCSFEAAIIGSVYGEQIKKLIKAGRYRRGIYDPTLEVHTAWDLGYDDSTYIIFFQLSGNEVRIIDFYENHLQTIAHYCSQVLGYNMMLHTKTDVHGNITLHGEKGEEIEGLSHRRAYKYGHHHVPHDAKNKLLAAGGKSTVEQAAALGVVMFAHPAASQEDQIAAARLTLQNTYWDEDIAGDALETLKQYHFEWDEDKKIFKSVPLHDFSSHCADAYELLALVRQAGKIESKASQSQQFPLLSMQAGIVLPDISDIPPDIYKDDF